ADGVPEQRLEMLLDPAQGFGVSLVADEDVVPISHGRQIGCRSPNQSKRQPIPCPASLKSNAQSNACLRTALHPLAYALLPQRPGTRRALHLRSPTLYNQSLWMGMRCLHRRADRCDGEPKCPKPTGPSSR